MQEENKIYTEDEVLRLLTDLMSTALAWQLNMKNRYSLSEWQGYYDEWLKEKGLLDKCYNKK